MRISALSPLLLPAFVSARVLDPRLQAAPAAPAPSMPVATASSIPDSKFLVASTSAILYGENLEARQGGVPVGAPPAVPTTSSTTTAVAVPPAVPAAPAVTSIAAANPEGFDSVTVQWVETHIGTSRTWVPVTITMHFDAVPSQGPAPGEGFIGMGTLTGETGKTKTVIAAAAPTLGFGWMGVAVAAGVGLMGM